MTSPTPNSTARFRPDIEGLRAIAVLLVLLYHAGSPWFAGGFVGVDVFFVVSGYLITGLILKEVTTTGEFDFSRFYARRARRLLPALTVSMVGTGLLSWLVLPPNRWSDIAGDLIASSVYLMNWRLAGRSVDYLATDDALSPLQHFWSLAVEEQFYLFWPVLIVGAAWWARRRDRELFGPLLRGVLLIGGASMIWSIVYTNSAPARAYFVTTTRVWELALGALLAVAVPRLRMPARLGGPLSIAGVIAIILSGITFSAETVFPGFAALLPTAGSAAVIAAGGGASQPWLNRAISSEPLKITGGLSYSLYLWHWPLIVVATVFWDPLPVPLGLAVAFGSFVPAWLSKKYIEDPVRHNDAFIVPSRRAVAMGAACAGVGVMAGLILLVAVPRVAFSAAEGDGPPGAGVLSDGFSIEEAAPPIEEIIPNPVSARDDEPWGDDRDECHQGQDSPDLKPCSFGDTDGEISIALIGDSHAAQWLTALRDIADANGWRLDTYIKSACAFADVTVLDGSGNTYTSCVEWNNNLSEHLRGPGRPDLVITSNSHTYSVLVDGERTGPDNSRLALGQGLARTWSHLLDSGIPVIAIRDTPRPWIDVPECVLLNHPETHICIVPLDEAMYGNTPQVLASDIVPTVSLIDLTSSICPEDLCVPVIGNVLVWRDSNHLSATYVKSLTAILAAELQEHLPSWSR